MSSNARLPSAPLPTWSVDDLLAHPADIFVTLHPPAILRDGVYGPLLQRASAMAAAYAGPRTMATTALAALERCEEVIVASNDGGSSEPDVKGEAVVVLRGVPADLDAAHVVDERATPIWRPLFGDGSRRAVEYEPVEYDAGEYEHAAHEHGARSDAALFVLPRRIWIIATGEAKSRTRQALLDPIAVSSLSGEEAALAVVSIRGAALVRKEDRLRDGALAPIGRSLLRASFELAPGAEGVIDARLSYADPSAAHAAEQTARDVIAAFRRALVSPDPLPLAWLAAAQIERTHSTVAVRARIPKPWLDALAQANVAASPAGSTPGSSDATTHPGDVPWQLWHRPPAPLSSERASERAPFGAP